MGKRAKKFKPKHNSSKKVKAQWNSTSIPNENQLFRSYYELQLNLPQQQFQHFWALMKEKLPVVFRINASTPNHLTFMKKVQNPNFMQSMVDMQIEKQGQEKQKQWLEPKEMPKLQVLQWYPGQVLHQLNTSKQMFKKSKVLNNLHLYLQKAFDAGLIARQQLVSMLPPLYLDIHSSDIVLDMCAAPGSKTSQLLQMIYGEQKNLAEGCVIANDADYSRAQMLIHQINRSGTAGMAVINHPGQFMPELYTHKINHIKQKFQFDKILCDVPCSGDGATRKLPIKWAKWHTSDGVSLHPLQLSILMKSINLLKRGGLILYSTCSLNPIENEAVLSALFKKVSKGLEIIDIHGKYNIKGRRGMSQWKVCAQETLQQKNQEGKIQKIKHLRIYNSVEDLKHNSKLKESMFPPSLDQAQKMQLNNSMRMLPHDNNSGGFFLALIKKHDNFEWNYSKGAKQMQQDQQQKFVQSNLPQVENPVFKEGQDKKMQEDDNSQDQEKPQEQLQKPKKVEEVEEAQEVEKEQPQQFIQNMNINQDQHPIPVKKTEQVPQPSGKNLKKSKDKSKYQKFENISEQQFFSISKFYSLDPALKKLLYIRDIEDNPKKKVLLISQGVRKFLDTDTENKIKLINMGCKVFQKGKESFAGHQCLYRLSQEGIHFMLPFMKARKIKVSLQFFKSVIKIHSLVHDQIEDDDVRSQMKGMSQGSFCIFIDEEIQGRRVVDGVVGQNFKSSFHLLVGKQQLASLNLRYL